MNDTSPIHASYEWHIFTTRQNTSGTGCNRPLPLIQLRGTNHTSHQDLRGACCHRGARIQGGHVSPRRYHASCNVSVCPSYGRERKLQILDWSQSSGRLHFSVAVDNTLDASPVARLAGPLPGHYCLLVPLDVTWKPARDSNS